MKAERPLKVVFFQTDAGNELVREWLKELSKDDCKVIGTDILTVQYAWPVGKPLVDNLGDGIWEVRSRLPSDFLNPFSHHSQPVLNLRFHFGGQFADLRFVQRGETGVEAQTGHAVRGPVTASEAGGAQPPRLPFNAPAR